MAWHSCLCTIYKDLPPYNFPFFSPSPTEASKFPQFYPPPPPAFLKSPLSHPPLWCLAPLNLPTGAVGKSFLWPSCWSHPIFYNFWTYHKIVSNGETFKLLKTPSIWQCFKIPQIAGHEETCKSCQPPQILESTTRLSATGKNVNYWSYQICGNVWKYHKIARYGGNSSYWSHQYHQICGNVWKYHKIAGHGVKLNLLKPPNMWQWLENTARLQATRENLSFEATQHFAIFENTTRFSATGKHLDYWSHQICGNVWKYHKIAGHKKNLSYWSHPIFSNIWRYDKFTTNGVTFKFWSHQIYVNVLKYHKIAGTGNHRIASNGWKFTLLKPPHIDNIWIYPKIAGNGVTFKLLKPQKKLPCLEIPQVYHQRGKISTFDATKYLAMLKYPGKRPQTVLRCFLVGNRGCQVRARISASESCSTTCARCLCQDFCISSL